MHADSGRHGVFAEVPGAVIEQQETLVSVVDIRRRAAALVCRWITREVVRTVQVGVGRQKDIDRAVIVEISNDYRFSSAMVADAAGVIEILAAESHILREQPGRTSTVQLGG